MIGATTGDAAASLAALSWLVGAGVDTLVTDSPRNWLAAVPPPHLPPVVARVPAPVAAGTAARPTAPNSAAALAAGAADLAALDAALADFAHPLRRAEPPRLLTGNVASGIVILADQPEDGPAEALAARMLAAIGLDAKSCARGHLLPWSSPRPARDADIAAFAAFRARAFVLAAPRLVLAFGDKAVALAGTGRGIASTRGQWLDLDGVPMLATFHPRVLLSQTELKRLAWADLQAFAARLKGQ